MKLWLKGQTMLSILQRYRHLLQDLTLDDQDFLGGMKVCIHHEGLLFFVFISVHLGNPRDDQLR